MRACVILKSIIHLKKKHVNTQYKQLLFTPIVVIFDCCSRSYETKILLQYISLITDSIGNSKFINTRVKKNKTRSTKKKDKSTPKLE